MASEETKLERGRRFRRDAFGDEVMARMAEDKSAINQRWQSFITESAWGECWSDPTLSPRERSILMLGITAGLGRPDEMEGHTRFAIKNGLNEAQLEAILVQIAVYCGVPAGNMFAKAVSKATKK